MGTSTAFRAAATRRHSIPVPFFYNFRAENGTIRMDAGWKRIPVTAEDYRIHNRENVTGHLRIIHGGPAPTTYPFEFEHYPDLKHGQKFSLTREKLETWIDKTVVHEVNEGTALLYQSLIDAREYAYKKAIEAGLIQPEKVKTAAPQKTAVYEIV